MMSCGPVNGEGHGRQEKGHWEKSVRAFLPVCSASRERYVLQGMGLLWNAGQRLNVVHPKRLLAKEDA